MLRAPSARVLDDADEGAVHRLLATDPVAACVLAGRIEATGTAAAALGAPLWGFGAGRHLEAVCLAGANLIPFAVPGAERAAAAASPSGPGGPDDGARRSSARRRRGTALGLLAPHWGPARDHRPRQPLMAIDTTPAVAAEPRVRLVRPAELETLLPAAVAMFTEEVGVSPLRVDGGLGYRPASPSWSGPGSRWPGSRTARCCSRPRSVRSPAPPARCRASGWRPAHRGRGIGTAGHRGRGRVRAQLHRPGGQPVRQRLQPGRPRGLPPGRVP